MTTEEMYDILVDGEYATEDEIDLVCAINGYNTETMESILFVRTGYRTFDQLCDEFR